MTLEERLNQIMTGHDTHLINEIGNDRGWSPEEQKMVVTNIIQAFKDEGWVDTVKRGKNGEIEGLMVHHVPLEGYMSGKEWFDRFEKEFEKNHNGMPLTSMESKMRAAAKKASNL